jgi:hypothetical protein
LGVPTLKERIMPRILVMTDPPERYDAAVLLDEQVHAVHLSSGHSAIQLVERLRWAISDAETAEHTHDHPPANSRHNPPTHAHHHHRHPAHA